jgi:hypothetical protein
VLQVQTVGTTTFTQGGVQTQTNPFISSSNYSAVLLASFQISTVDVLATKVLDFKNLSSDAGLYVDDATGLLGFYDGSGMLLGASTSPFLSGQYVQIVLTRNSANNSVTVYANGTAQFSFTDSTGLAILGDKTSSGNSFLTLFQDDGTGLGGTTVAEGTVGDIARLRLYDGVLSPTQIAGLPPLATVPEASATALLGVGGIFLAGLAARRRPAAR